MAENHPVAYRWPMKARVNGATLIHVDPRFTRTSAMSNIYAPIRAGSDIPFLGGLITYVITSQRWNTDPFFREWVVSYTNAATLISEEFKDTEDLDGVFSGFSNTTQKCTLCYDRLQAGMEPACSKACPTDSLRFGNIVDLKRIAAKRVEQLHEQGERRAHLYGADDRMLGGLGAFFLLVDRPEVYGLPPDPQMPSRNLVPSSVWSTVGAVAVGLLGLISFRTRRTAAAPVERRRDEAA